MIMILTLAFLCLKNQQGVQNVFNNENGKGGNPMLKINGTTIKTPSKMEIGLMDIDGETNRNARGEMIRDRIATKRKISCEWPAMSQSEASALLNAVKDTFFSIEFPDPRDGIITKTCYVGDRSIPMYRNINGQILWESIKMNFIEK